MFQETDSGNSPAPAPAPTPASCAVPSWQGDKYCDDENNTAGCNWDGGDCCKNSMTGWNFYCNDCKCLDPSA